MTLASKGSDRSPHQRLRQLGIALVLATTAFGAQAAGLGRLNLLSGIGQPLRAEIELTSVARDEAGSLTARLASPDAFGQAGIEYSGVLSALRFSIQRRANGVPYVLVTSNQQVNDPYIDVLVELSWNSGRLVREYTMLLDPPETRAARTEVDPGQTIVQAQSPAAATRAAPAPASSTGSGAGVPVPAPRTAAAAPVPIPAPSSSSGQYVVQNGDTAMSIARVNKPDGVSLEQMLAVLYRDNPQAFTGNINRLMAGATVKLPDAAAAQAVDGVEAHRIVAQSANFGRYRDRIAQSAGEAPVARPSGQQASGRLSTQVQDNGTPAADARDRLQLSRPDAVRPAATAAGGRSGATGPSAEELAAKDRELSETRSRLAQLEKSVADLQELLKLKNQTLADLQKNAPIKGAPAAAPAPLAPTTLVAPVAPATPPNAAPAAPASAPVASTPAPAPAPSPAPVAVAPPAPVKAAAAPAPAATSEGSWYDSLMDNTLLLIGLVVLLLMILGYVFITMQRRRKLSRFEDSIFVDNSVLHANSVFGTTGGQSVDTANSTFHSNFVPVAGHLPEQSEVDPVAEADVYIAYGRDAQAEEILKEALRADPARHVVRLKLLEIYAKRGDAKTFETMASEFYAATGGHGDEWKRAAALGASIDPRNPLYSESVVAAPAPLAETRHLATDFAATTALPSPASLALGAAAMTVPVAFAASGLGRNAGEDDARPAPTSVDHTRTDPMPRPTATQPPPSMDLDFDLGMSGQGSVAPLQAPAPPVAPAPGHDATLDFNVSEAEKPALDPFTASAFSGSDASIRTAVNLPAFRARAEQPQPNEPPSAPRPDSDGFTASDIFGSSIVAHTEPMESGESHDVEPPAPRISDFRNDLDAQAFDKTEPLDAFSKINLDLDDGDYGASVGKTDFGQKTDVWQAMATKLDLALAYSDIGDKDGARELLDEVVRNGDQAQADRARTLIGGLD